MSKNDCGWCDELRLCNGNIGAKDWYTLAARLLCDIDDAAQAIQSNTATVPTSAFTPLYAEVAAASVTNAFVAAITDAHNKVEIVVDNETNQGIYLSYDGTHTHEFVAPSSARVLRLGEYNKYHAGNIYIKYASAQPTAGSVTVSAVY